MKRAASDIFFLTADEFFLLFKIRSAHFESRHDK